MSHHRLAAPLTALAALIALAGCGGGSAGDAPAVNVAHVRLAPTYHLSPVLPGDPGDADRDGRSASAGMAPRTTTIPPSRLGATTRALTYQDLADADARARAQAAGGAEASPQAGAASVTYTPAQIRAAYGLPPVPSDLRNLTPLQAAQLGAGQTIYVVDAFHDPYAYGELMAFSNLFGLPGCTQQTLPTTASLPLAAADASQITCEFYQVASGDAGTIAATPPRYDAQWATEIAMDIQWAHAIAPLARIVLIEAAAADMGSIASAIQLANRMGAGVVSMSFAATEGGYVADSEALFQAEGMSYFAATGDHGSAVNWPAVSPSVVAVGGTSLRYNGTGPRVESAWSLAGGGVSAFVATPSYQGATVLRTPAVPRRSVADVAMNADPLTGQFVAVIPNPLTCTFCQVSWVTAGGTSLSTPQWAGLAAVANALRARVGKGPLGAPHALLYQSLYATSAYGSAFLDITQGGNGACATCAARVGYDGPTGLGTPRGLSLLHQLAGDEGTASAPGVVPATVNGAYGQAIAFTPSVSSPNGYALSISGAPAGMVVAGATVRWPSPRAGTFNVRIEARDLKSGLSGSGIVTVVVAPPPAPIVGGGSLTATVGRPFALPVSAADRYPCTLRLVGAPAGMTLGAAGFNSANLAWVAPRAGTYRFVVRADNAQTGLSGLGSYTLVVNPAGAPQVAAGQVSARAGVPFSMTVGVAAAHPTTLSLVGAPAGLSIDGAGLLSWDAPVAGTYAIVVQAQDTSTGVVGSGVINLSIGDSPGPAILGSVMAGVAGRPFSGTVWITDAGAGLAGVGFSGSHSGIRFETALGMATTTVNWAAPVAGNHSIRVSVTDQAGKTTLASIPLTISAR